MIVSKEKLSQRKEFPMSTVGHSPKKRPGYLLGEKSLSLTYHAQSDLECLTFCFLDRVSM